MHPSVRRSALVAVAIACALAGACASGSPREVIVSAASSLAGAMEEVEARYEALNPDVDIVLNIGGTPLLVEQLLAGAPADVVVLAGDGATESLESAGLVRGKATKVATNAIGLAVPQANPGGVDDVMDAADPELLVGVCAIGVPCGDLARSVLAQAGVDARIDTSEPNVLALVTKLVSGELDLGFVYTTDVLGSGGRLTEIALPSGVGASTTYPAFAVSGSDVPDLADDVLAFLASDTVAEILGEYGFGAP